jgi:hypothetical protein
MELVYRTSFATRQQARSAIFEYIEVFYDRQRRHSTLGYLSPVDYERATAVPVGEPELRRKLHHEHGSPEGSPPEVLPWTSCQA